ncbi:MAG: outer membrane beta-barrel protein, partial [Bacteroidales bacterium]
SRYDGGELGFKLIFGYHAGLNAVIPVGPDLFFQPGVLYSTKGAKQEILANTTRTTKLSYIEMPLNFLFRPQLGDGHILLGAGPYIALGIAGVQRDYLDNILSNKLTVKFKNSTDTDYAYYKPLDFGGNIFFGYEFYSGIFCQINAQMGLYEINPDFELSDDKTSKKNIGFGFSAGYRF